MAFLQPGIFVRHDPEIASVPLVVDVSRSGREYPKEFRSPLPFTVLHDNVSMYCEDVSGLTPIPAEDIRLYSVRTCRNVALSK